MRVLVTGGSGCIGSWVMKGLLDRGLDVLMYDLQADTSRLSLITSPDAVRRVVTRTGAIEDTAAVKSLVKDEAITHVVHLAAVLMPFCKAHPVRGALVNVAGTLNVFEAARDSGREVRIVYASSSAVWGPRDLYEDRPLTESDPPMPATHYGIFKHANERNARVFYDTDGISSIGLRPWTVYGVGRDNGMTADPTLAIRAVALEQPFQIRVSGNMDLQYTDDVAEAFIRCLLSPVSGAHVFNLAGDIVSMDDFIQLVEQASPDASRLISAAGPEVPVAFRMDDSMLRSTVGEMPRTPLREGVRLTLDGFRRLRAEGRLQ